MKKLKRRREKKKRLQKKKKRLKSKKLKIRRALPPPGHRHDDVRKYDRKRSRDLVKKEVAESD